MSKDELGAPPVVDRSIFQAERDALRVREKAHTKEGDAIAAARRRLPMVEVDGASPLIGSHGCPILCKVEFIFTTDQAPLDAREKESTRAQSRVH
jgi:Bacterial protein of unknown function (DUF899)